jgi:hypothetical protein
MDFITKKLYLIWYYPFGGPRVKKTFLVENNAEIYMRDVMPKKWDHAWIQTLEIPNMELHYKIYKDTQESRDKEYIEKNNEKMIRMGIKIYTVNGTNCIIKELPSTLLLFDGDEYVKTYYKTEESRAEMEFDISRKYPKWKLGDISERKVVLPK